MRFTSYEDKGNPTPIGKLDSNTADGLRTCYQKTEHFAKAKTGDIPENTRSNPADRIKSFREHIAWGKFADKEPNVLRSPFFKKSAILFIHCVLSPVYGDTITLESHSFQDLNKEKKYLGRTHFLNEIKKALYGDDDENVGMKMDRNEILFIYHNQKQGKKLIGLMSAAGPIPAMDYAFSFKGLTIDNTAGTKTLIDALTDQDKQILKFWLDTNHSFVEDCDLYKDIKGNLENVVVPDQIREELQIDRLSSGFPHFPFRENYEEEILSDTSITIVPLYGSAAKFGYNLPPLKIEIDGIPYACIPPLTEKALERTKEEKFKIQTISLYETIVEHKLDSLRVDCEILTGKGFKSFASRTYTREQIWYVKKFPALSIYGPSPQFGWIARRDLAPKDAVVSPLAGGYDVMIDGLADIEFENLPFTPVEEKVEDNYSVYCGAIPQWAGVKGNGNWLGAVPLCVDPVNAMQADWKKAPLFIHRELPSSKKMKVAVDIGSSRSVVLFWEDLMDESKIEYTLVEDKQLLKIDVTSPIDKNRNQDREAVFGDTLFQPEIQYHEVKGKTPLAIIPTSQFYDKDVLLYRSGKLLLLDRKSLFPSHGTQIISDIKAHMREDNEKKQAMKVLVQGVLTMIIERALHLGCSDIDIRTAYLTEQYNMMRKIWGDAKEQLESRMPSVKVSINVDLCLPESLAIANMMSRKGFRTGSGVALVDIGDFSTDIALFKNTSQNASGVELLKNFSVHFAGTKILVYAIWDYLRFTEKVKPESLFEKKADDEQYEYISPIYGAISKALAEHSSRGNVSNAVRSNILCLMNRLQKGKIPEKLQNLFDLGYLVEVSILKRLVTHIPEGNGIFNIHLFGGGSSHFRAQKDGFNWSEVLGRPCETYNESTDGNILALGLLWGVGDEIHENIRSAAKKEKEKAVNYEKSMKKTTPLAEPDEAALKQSYVEFIAAAESLKTTWHFKDSDGNNINTRWVFNIQKQEGEQPNYEPLDAGLWACYHDHAMEFARECMTDDVEIFKLLFAYKMAYTGIVEFYRGKRIPNEDEE